MKIWSSIGLITISLSLLACSSSLYRQKDIKSVALSTSYGMCKGYCNTKVEANMQHTSTSFTSNEPDLYVPKLVFKKTSEEDWTTIKNLATNKQIQQADSIYGCPGCADGGIRELIIETNNSLKTIRFEAENPPQALVAISEKLLSLQAQDKPDDQAQVQLVGENVFKDVQVTVKNFVCSRGCYQWVLVSDKGRWYDPSLPEAYQQDGITLKISGELTANLKPITKPAPNDVPVKDFDATIIKVSNYTKL